MLLVGDEKQQLLGEVCVLAEVFEGVFALMDCGWV